MKTSGSPAKIVFPSWRISEVFPCMSFGARTTWPPNVWPRAWWPRQTPRRGTGERRMSSRLIPASSGVPGPGEITMRSGRSARASSTLIASLRTTFTSAPSSPRYWYRLNVKES